MIWVLAAVLLAALAGLALADHYRRRGRLLTLLLAVADRAAERAEQTVTAVIENAERAGREAAEALADLDARNARLSAQLAEARAKTTQAYDEGYRALAMLDEAIARQHDEFLDSLTAWQGIAGSLLVLAAPPPAALPAAPRAPELLPSGEHAYVDGDPGLLVQVLE